MVNKHIGRLIVFEGIDGSGKATQAKLLLEFLAKEKIPTEFVSFPRYDSVWGKMIRRYLDGDFGKVDEVNPYLASVLYAGDRASAAPQVQKWLTDGKIVVCDRYVGSNMAHMGGKIKNLASPVGRQKLKIKFIEWLEKLEYQENKIPREDLVIFLSVPVLISQKLMDGRKLDIHEADVSYLKEVTEVYETLVQSRKNWVKIECVQNGSLFSPEVIHQKVLEVLKQRKVL